jgi:hypothetical protein
MLGLMLLSGSTEIQCNKFDQSIPYRKSVLRPAREYHDAQPLWVLNEYVYRRMAMRAAVGRLLGLGCSVKDGTLACKFSRAFAADATSAPAYGVVSQVIKISMIPLQMA